MNDSQQIDSQQWNDFERLQAYVDDELQSEERAAIQDRLREDAGARALVAELAALREDLDGLGEAVDASTWPSRAPHRSWFLALTAAAAAVVVGLLWLDRGADKSADEVENEYIRLRCAPQGSGHAPIFSNRLGVTLEIEPKTARRLCVVPTPGDLSKVEAAYTAAVAEAGPAAQLLPLYISAAIEDPSGRMFLGAWDTMSVTAEDGGAVRVDLALWDLEVKDLTLDPIWTVRPTASGGWERDFEWGFRQHGEEPDMSPRRFTPSTPGVHLVRLMVQPIRCAQAAQPDGAWPELPTLEIATNVVVDGVATPWGEPVLGLRARLVTPKTVVEVDEVVPVSLQLELVAKRNGPTVTKKYNVMGPTRVKIPQPFHVECFVDGQEAQQKKRMGVVVPYFVSGLRHRSPSIRELILHPSMFEIGGQSICAKPGRYRLKLGLHSKPLMVVDSFENWQGRVFTPEIEIEVR